MALEKVCAECKNRTIPRRIKGYYAGSKDMIRIWECRRCGYLWQ